MSEILELFNFNGPQATLRNSQGAPLILKDVAITGELRGAMFEAHVRQTFSNPTETHAEVVYSFPLPWGATLLGVEVQLGQVKLNGTVVAKAQAAEQYEESLSKGDAAIVLERGNDGHYVLHLGNLAPGEQCLIDMHYGQLLQFEQGGLRLAIPTVIAPRYGDAVREGGLAPYQVPETDLLAEYGFSLTLDLHGDLVNARIASPSHPISVARSQSLGALKEPKILGVDENQDDTSNETSHEQQANATDIVTIALTQQSYLDRDFILVLDQLDQCSVATIAPDHVDKKTFVATASFSPSIPNAKAQNTAVKILVDCSGSMAGGSIQAARRALMAIVKKFNTGDKFSLSKFGSSVEHRSLSLWTASEQSRLGAEKWIAELQADMGGTDMLEAIESTFALAHSSPCDVLLITDGQIYGIDDMIKKAKASKHRVFSVGIGSSPSENLLRRLAVETNGACDFVASGETVEPAIVRMFNRLRSPAITKVSVQWPEGFTPKLLTYVDSTAFDGDTLHASAWFSAKPTGRITLLGQLVGQDAVQELGSVEINQTSATSTALSRLAAAGKMQHLGDATKATKLALDYQLVTEHTNFLMLHERSAEEKANNMPELHKVKQMLPAGWGGAGLNQVQFSMRLASDSSMQIMSENISTPALIRGRGLAASTPTAMRGRGLGQPRSLSSGAATADHYDIPAFLRRQGDPVPTVNAVGQRITIKADRIWFKLNDAQETIFALFTPNPQAIGARIWFVNQKHEVFDYMDFVNLEDAVNELQLNGFSDYVKKKFSLLNRVRTRYTWQCQDHTRSYSNSSAWLHS
ncbi:MAG: VWA domain-containing protein [Alcaligenaceae bacterium]|nr:VWA domain-containing protein [Alcaligenaceae bacterium]